MTETDRLGRGRRTVAVLLSLILPAGGHFLLGHFGRGALWIVGVSTISFGLLFTLPVGLVPIALALGVAVLGRVAIAVDAVFLAVRKPRWIVVMAAWAALIAAGFLVEPLKDFYKSHYGQAFTIPSAAMRDSLLVGDYILVDRSAYRKSTPQRGDIIVFEYPLDERRDFIKRIIGTPGDVISVRDGQVVLNGAAVHEPYVRRAADVRAAGGTGACRYTHGCDPITVPPDSYFVMGDSRDNSQDSRYWGFVNRRKIKGKAIVIYWSWDSERHWLRQWRVGRPIS